MWALISQLQLKQRGASSPTLILQTTWEDNLSGSFSSGDETFHFIRVHRPGKYDYLTDSKQAAVGPEVEVVMGSKPLWPMLQE